MLFGPPNTGAKTSLMDRIINNKFGSYMPTVGADFKMLKIESKYGIIFLQIWDIPGQDSFKNDMKPCFKAAHGIILGYDITDIESFDLIKNSYYDYIIDNFNKDNILLINLVANKIDIDDKIKIPDEIALSFAKRKNNRLF